MIQREDGLARLVSWREKQLIKVVTGVRRCGKSTLLALYADHLRSTGVREQQIVTINLEDPEHGELREYRSLYAYIQARLCPSLYTYIFIDEVQQCAGFERAVDGLFVQKNTDIYITGSNAYMLSGELATLLSGRYVEIPLLPLSFKEYLETVADPEPPNLRNHLADYLSYGSFPYITALNKDGRSIKTYIDGIYNTILIKDVAKREGIRDISMLEQIVKFLASSIGSPVSTKKITDTIISGGRRISVNTVEQYLRALTDSYIFYRADRYDIKGKQHLKTLGKYFIVDTGIRSLLLASSSADLGHLLENIVYFELRRRSLRVSIGKLGEQEVDFVAHGASGLADGLGGGELAYYQVAATLLDPAVLERELSPLRKIQDNYPKFLLTLDDIPKTANYDGIRQINLIDWLTPYT
jgi:predicted AAA+ superfamily ATPase